MSRIVDITLFIVLLQASIGFVSATGLFTHDYVDTSTVGNVKDYNIENLRTLNGTTASPGIADILSLGILWLWEAIKLVFQILIAVAIAWLPLVYTFHVPPILATFLQVGVYFTYAMFLMQLKSGRGTKLYDY